MKSLIRNHMTALSNLAKPLGAKKILLIDDDPLYTEIVKRAFEREGIELYAFPSMEAMGSVGALVAYDGAVLDVNIGHVNGLDIAQYIEFFRLCMPVILISAQDKPQAEGYWPRSIKCFVAKSRGVETLIETIRVQLERYES